MSRVRVDFLLLFWLFFFIFPLLFFLQYNPVSVHCVTLCGSGGDEDDVDGGA